MVFMVTMGVKLLYYILLKMHRRLGGDMECPPPDNPGLHT